MPDKLYPGEFEQVVMLSLLQLGEDAHAITVRHFLGEHAERRVSRGALYRTLDRLEAKGYIAWETDEPSPERGGHAKRRFFVTERGLAVLRANRKVLFKLWSGLEPILGEA